MFNSLEIGLDFVAAGELVSESAGQLELPYARCNAKPGLCRALVTSPDLSLTGVSMGGCGFRKCMGYSVLVF